jgi:hypothetical protein
LAFSAESVNYNNINNINNKRSLNINKNKTYKNNWNKPKLPSPSMQQNITNTYNKVSSKSDNLESGQNNLNDLENAYTIRNTKDMGTENTQQSMSEANMLNNINNINNINDENGESDGLGNFYPLSKSNNGVNGNGVNGNGVNGNGVNGNGVNGNNVNNNENPKNMDPNEDSNKLDDSPETINGYSYSKNSFIEDSYKQYTPLNNDYGLNSNSLSGYGNDALLKKLDTILHILEEQHDEKTNYVTEELILYIFLGIFIIYVIDSFVRAGKYIR